MQPAPLITLSGGAPARERERRRRGDERGTPSSAPSANPRVATIVARIPAREAAGEIVEEVRSAIAAFGRLSGTAQADIAVGIERNLWRWYEWLSTGIAPPDSVYEPLRDWVRGRATEGVGLEDLQRAFGLAGHVGCQLIRRYARDDEADAVMDAAGLLMQSVGRVSAVATDTYLGERRELVSEDERRTRSFMDRICGESPLDPDDRELADRLRVPLEAAYTPFAIVMPRRSPQRHAALSARLRRRGWKLAVTEGDRVVGLAWTPLAQDDLDEGSDVLLVIGEPTPRAELTEARADVVLLAEHGRRVGLRGRLESGDHLLDMLVLRSPRTMERLRERVLAPVSAPEHEELLGTLRAFISSRFDRARTAATLHIHRNTLAYRLRRIEELAGLDLKCPRDLAYVYLAVATFD
jgi:PucR C-terminal helix-turn-helix domain